MINIAIISMVCIIGAILTSFITEFFITPLAYLKANKFDIYYIRDEESKIEICDSILEFTINNNVCKYCIDGSTFIIKDKEKITVDGKKYQFIDNRDKARFKEVWRIFVSALFVAPMAFLIFNKYPEDLLAHAEDKVSINDYNVDGDTEEDTIIISSTNACDTEIRNGQSVLEISEKVIFTDVDDNQLSAQEIIGKTLCVQYKGEQGETCYFMGQYDDNYSWDGECLICAYKNDKLLYWTDDIYDGGILKEYTRFSIKTKSDGSKRWIVTNKAIEDSYSIGDSKSYSYIDIEPKMIDAELSKDSFYSYKELQTIVGNGLILHYSGKFDEQQNWCDDSGDAFLIKYNNGNVFEIYKGTFKNNHFIEGWMIQKDANGEYTLTSGKLRDDECKVITGEAVTEKISKEQAQIYFVGEAFEEEVSSF